MLPFLPVPSRLYSILFFSARLVVGLFLSFYNAYDKIQQVDFSQHRHKDMLPRFSKSLAFLFLTVSFASVSPKPDTDYFDESFVHTS